MYAVVFDFIDICYSITSTCSCDSDTLTLFGKRRSIEDSITKTGTAGTEPVALETQLLKMDPSGELHFAQHYCSG